MIAPCYAISIKFHTDRQTDRATTRGPIGPKKEFGNDPELDNMKYLGKCDKR